MLKNKIIIVGLFLSVFCLGASSPVKMLETMSDSLLLQLSSNKDISSDKNTVLVNIIKNTLLPKIDTAAMSRIVIGPVHWRGATEDERKDFIKEFTTMVTNNYAKIFAVYSDQKVKFLPSRFDDSEDARVEVQSIVTSNKGSDFKVSYKLQKNTAGEWVIYDFAIDGISMTESYKAQFASTLSTKGLAGVIAHMRKYNNRQK